MTEKDIHLAYQRQTGKVGPFERGINFDRDYRLWLENIILKMNSIIEEQEELEMIDLNNPLAI
jgi:hypothetical protein